MANTPPIFVSHSHTDNDWCRTFVSVLRQHGADVWYDEHNLGYGVLGDEIEHELRARPVFIVALSPESIKSQWVTRELEGALHLLSRDPQRVFLPVMAQYCDVPLLLIGYKRISGPEDAGLSPKEAAARVAKALGIDPNLNVTSATLTQPEILPTSAQPLPPTEIPEAQKDTTTKAAATAASSDTAQTRAKKAAFRHAITDLYDEDRHSFLVLYPVPLIVGILASGLFVCGLAGFFGYQDNAEPAFTKALFQYPWPLFLWLCTLILFLEMSILRDKRLRSQLLITLSITVLAILLVSSAEFGLLGFLRPLGQLLTAITTSAITYSAINFGLIMIYWLARIGRWPLHFQLSTPSQVISDDLTGSIILALILAGVFWSPFLHLVHVPVNECLVSWPLGGCSMAGNVSNPPTLTSIDLVLAAVFLVCIVLALGVRAILSQLAALGALETPNPDRSGLGLGQSNVRYTSIRLLTFTIVLNSRMVTWPLLLFAAVFFANKAAVTMQQHLHVLSDEQTCNVPGHLSCTYVQQHLLATGEPFISLGLALVFICAVFMVCTLAIAVLVFRWRVADNTFRFMALIGFIVLISLWLFSIALSGFNGILWLLNHNVRVPFPQPDPLTIFSFVLFLLWFTYTGVRRLRRERLALGTTNIREF